MAVSPAPLQKPTLHQHLLPLLRILQTQQPLHNLLLAVSNKISLLFIHDLDHRPMQVIEPTHSPLEYQPQQVTELVSPADNV